jgi:hypothetical protein
LSATGLEPAAPAYPAPVQLERVKADPHAARRLARGYRDAASVVEQAQRDVRRALHGLPWVGQGASARWLPVDKLVADLRQVGRGLRDAAEALERYARELEKAHEHHRWSLKKLAVLGAVVIVTAAAVTVTMGAAAVAVGTAEVALAESALAGAGAAVAAATAAEAGAASALLSSAALMTGLRALGTFVLPRLAQAELAGGLSALQQEAMEGRISGSRVLLDMQLGLVGAGVGSAGLRALSRAELEGVAAWVAPHLVVGGTVAGTSALGQWETTGSVDGLRVARDGVFGSYFSAVGWTIARNAALGRAPAATRREIEISRQHNWGNPDLLDDHALRHGAALGIEDAETYAARAQDMLRRAEAGELEWGWDAGHGSIAVLERERGIYAAFRPGDDATKTLLSLLTKGRDHGYVDRYWRKNVEPWPRGIRGI